MNERETSNILFDANGREIKKGSKCRLSEKGRTQSSIAIRFPEFVAQFPNLRFEIMSLLPLKDTPTVIGKVLESEIADPYKMPVFLRPEDVVIEIESE